MFKKYPSITNHYSNKDIKYFLECCKHLSGIQYAVFEKSDGSNFSFLFSPGEKVRYFSRKKEITGSYLYGAEDAINGIVNNPTLNRLASMMPRGDSFRLFGELFGLGIQKRIDYGNEKRILFFDMMINDRMIPLKQMENLFNSHDILDMMIRPLAIYHDFETALNYNEVFTTTLSTNNSNSKAEGIVIKPWNTCIFTPQGSIFYIKKKNPEFADKMKNRTPKEKEIYRDEVENMRNEFMSYVNSNTVNSVFSKEGEISTAKDIGKYIKLILEDAKDTFFREVEFDETQYDKKEIKYIFNVGSTIKDLLTPYL